MRSYLRPSPRRWAASTVSASSLLSASRCIFVREAWTPATLQGPDPAASPTPARLLWQFRSSTPHHVTLCVRGPAPSAAADVDDTSSATATAKPEDFIYGRLFLRPYNVAQLLAVLQGWGEGTATVERQRSFLQLTPVDEAAATAHAPTAAPAGGSSAGVAAAPAGKPAAVQLTAQLTRKVIPRGALAAEQAAAVPHTEVDPAASEDYPESTYLEGERGTLTAVLRDAELVLLTAHLESVLSDLFGLEQRHITEAARRIAGGQRGTRREEPSHGPSKDAGQRFPKWKGREEKPERPRSASSAPQYLSQSVLSQRLNAPPAVAAAASSPSAAASVATVTANVAMEDLFEDESAPEPTVQERSAPAHTSTPDTNDAAAAAAVQRAQSQPVVNEDDDFEVIEEIEVEDDETLSSAEVAGRDGDASSPSPSTATTDATSSAAAAADGDAAPLRHVPQPAAPSTTTYHATHTTERGEATVESDTSYATGRFVRSDGVAAAEVAAVSRIGDFDVMRRTRQVEAATECDGAQTTVRATQTTGAFRSSGGDVSGTFAYERMSAETVAASEAVAAAHVHRGGDSAARTDDGATTTIEATAVEEAAAAADGAAAEKKAARKRSSAPSGGKKKATRKKDKKASTRKAAGKAKAASKKPAADPSSSTMSL